MSVEKLSDQSRTIIENNPYAQILNYIIENIKDNDAFRLYAYLVSKSRDWKVIKQYAAKVCGIGETKAKKCWSYLYRAGLIDYIVNTNDQGKIVNHDMHVLNGLKFNELEPFLSTKKLSTEKVKTTGLKTRRVENHTCGKTPTTKERYILNKDIHKKKREPARKKRVPLSDDFLFDDKTTLLCYETASKVGISAEKLLEKFKDVCKKYGTQAEDWNAAFRLFLEKEKPDKSSKPEIINQPHSTVKEWGPGHPGWESIHGNKLREGKVYDESQGRERNAYQHERAIMQSAKGLLS